MSKLRDSKRQYSVDEEGYSHPRNAPYKRPHNAHWEEVKEEEDDGELEHRPSSTD